MNIQKKQIVGFLNALQERESKICNLVHIPFTGLGAGQGFRGDEWFAKRIEIFKNTTLKSLLYQSNPFFTIWCSFREEEVGNPLTGQLWDYMQQAGLSIVFTFGGIPIWDDKYPDEVEGQRLLKKLQNILPELKSVAGNADYVYMTNIASDDCYHKDVIQSIHQQEYADRRALVHYNGYIYNNETKQLAEWKPEMPGHLPPFFTIMYPAKTFLNPQKHFDYIAGYKSHEFIETLFDNVRLPDGRYLVNVHGNNISTSWWWKRDENKLHPFIGKEITDETEKQKILWTFGMK